MASLILVRGIRQLLTLHGPSGPRRGAALNELGIIRDGALLIRDGVVHSVGPSRRIENLAISRNAEEIGADGRVVIPGFVDSHTHLLMTALPARLEEAEGGDSTGGDDPDGYHMIGQRLRTFPSGRLELQAREFLLRLAAHGTTTVEVKAGWGPDEASEAKLLRVMRAADHQPLDVVSTYLAGRVVPNGYSGTGEWVDALCGDLFEKWKRLRLARFADMDAACPGLDTAAIRRYYEAARRVGLDVKAHLGRGAGPEALRLAIEFEAVSADHLDDTPEDDLATLANSSTIATLIPGRNFIRNEGLYPPGRRLVDAGAAVALASGFHPLNTPGYSMQMVISLACARMGLTPAEAISMATINGAHALRMAHRVGSLEPGKIADLLILNVSDYREIGHLLGVNSVATTIKRGEVVRTESACPAS